MISKILQPEKAYGHPSYSPIHLSFAEEREIHLSDGNLETPV